LGFTINKDAPPAHNEAAYGHLPLLGKGVCNQIQNMANAFHLGCQEIVEGEKHRSLHWEGEASASHASEGDLGGQAVFAVLQLRVRLQGDAAEDDTSSLVFCCVCMCFEYLVA
jgi:hypothetical protein